MSFGYQLIDISEEHCVSVFSVKQFEKNKDSHSSAALP